MAVCRCIRLGYIERGEIVMCNRRTIRQLLPRCFTMIMYSTHTPVVVIVGANECCGVGVVWWAERLESTIAHSHSSRVLYDSTVQHIVSIVANRQCRS